MIKLVGNEMHFTVKKDHLLNISVKCGCYIICLLCHYMKSRDFSSSVASSRW